MRTTRNELIVTADDGGMRPTWDDAIVAAHDAGVVSAVAIVANGASYESMREKLRGSLRLSVGVHLNVFDGRPLCEASRVRTLLGRQGRFLDAVTPILGRYATAQFDPDEVEREWAAQIDRVVADGLAPAHLSSHYHLHMLPRLFEVVLRLADRFSIPWVRLVDERPRTDAPGPAAFAKTAALWCISRRNRRRVDSARSMHARGIARSGRFGMQAWRYEIDSLPPPPVEIICHPGQSEMQTRALMSAEVTRLLRSHRRIVGFREVGGCA